MHVLCPVVNKGNERETLFYCQLQVNNDVEHPLKGDFHVNDKYLFEVGGRKKSFEQIADVPNSRSHGSKRFEIRRIINFSEKTN